MNWIQIDVVYRAWTGDLEPLAVSIEAGQALTEEASEFLCLFLRGEVKWPRGNRRLYTQIVRDVELSNQIAFRSEHYGLSIDRAIREHCEETGTSYETVRSALKRAKGFSGELHPRSTVRPGNSYLSLM